MAAARPKKPPASPPPDAPAHGGRAATTKTARVQRLLARPIDWPVPRQAVAMIAMEEDCRLEAYLCPAGVWTCGWGETDGVVKGMRWTQDYADERFRQSLFQWGQGLRAMLTAPATDDELSAMLSLAYNIGLGGFARSTVLRQHNAGNKMAAARAFRLWNKATIDGWLQELPALTARRLREEALYAGQLAEGPVPQAVQAESSLARSPIAQGGAATIAGGVAAILAAIGEQIEQAGVWLAPLTGAASAVTGFIERVSGIPPSGLAGVVLVGAGAAVVHWRRKQRAGGWA